MSKHIRLICWKAEEAEARAAKLREANYDVDAAPVDPAGMRALKANPPPAVVIDLGRLPSQGRDMALYLRKTKATRHVPIVFVDGDPEKVARVKELLPDATYTTWGRIRSALKEAIDRTLPEPVVPESTMAGYAGTPLPKKLGIKPKWVVLLVGAPLDFASTLGELPEGVVLRRQARGRCDLIVWFTESQRDLERRVERMGKLAGPGGLWICWRKRSSGVSTALTQNVVRQVGLASGLVDYKIAAIDSTWTGLRFTRRKKR